MVWRYEFCLEIRYVNTDYFEEALLKSDTFLHGKIILSYQVNVIVIVEKIYSIIG